MTWRMYDANTNGRKLQRIFKARTDCTLDLLTGDTLRNAAELLAYGQFCLRNCNINRTIIIIIIIIYLITLLRISVLQNLHLFHIFVRISLSKGKKIHLIP